MKKKYIILIILLLIVLISSILYINYKNNDQIKFKNEYESLNGKKSKSNKKIRTITIPKDNMIVYKTEEDIVNMINNKETFIVYFGFAECPWCRSVVPTLIQVAKDLKVEKIYYVDILNIRDVIELKGNQLEKTKKGTKGYNKLIKLLDPVLSDYIISDSKGNDVSAKEKRIYAPNVVVIVNGKAKKMDTGISDELTDPYMKLTTKIKKDTYNKFKCLLECIEEKNVCTKKLCTK